MKSHVVPTPQLIEKKKRSRVYMIGSLGRYRQVLEKEYEAVADFEWCNADKLNSLPKETRSGDLVLFDKFVSHMTTNKLRKKGIPIHPCFGGIDTIRDLLNNLLILNIHLG